MVFENRAATREKALADEANKQQRATAREKALADELRQAAVRDKALADEAKERHEAAAHAKALAAKVLADKQGGQESAVRGSPLQTVRQCARPRPRVGRRHGPRAPNPHEHLLCGQRYWPRAPNQSTVNGWA
jgi:hypothetical protein